MLIINFHAKIQQQRLILQLFSEKTQDTKELYTKMSIFYSTKDCAPINVETREYCFQKTQARDGRQVNEESIGFLSGLWLMRKP